MYDILCKELINYFTDIAFVVIIRFLEHRALMVVTEFLSKLMSAMTMTGNPLKSNYDVLSYPLCRGGVFVSNESFAIRCWRICLRPDMHTGVRTGSGGRMGERLRATYECVVRKCRHQGTINNYEYCCRWGAVDENNLRLCGRGGSRSNITYTAPIVIVIFSRRNSIPPSNGPWSNVINITSSSHQLLYYCLRECAASHSDLK